MRQGRTARSASRTAELVALIRDVAGSDPYAHHFIARDYRLLGRVVRRLDPRGRLTDRVTLGLTDAIRARHRWLDGLLVEAVGADAEQVVLLGAGFDARAWRFEAAIGDRPVYLVDHPATAEARAARGPGEAPGTHRVDVIFDEADFAEALTAAGFAWDRVAVFIWEGVTMYLPRATIEETLRRVADRACAGTRIGFDMVVARPPSAMPWRERVGRSVLAAMGEPVIDAIPSNDIRPLVEGCGLIARQIVPVRHAPGGEKAWPDMYFVEAAVPG